jgi:hypothetical protein
MERLEKFKSSKQEGHEERARSTGSSVFKAKDLENRPASERNNRYT